MAALLTMSFLQSCINDDLSYCFTEKRVYFDYAPITEAGLDWGIEPTDIKRINLYIFDEESKFVADYVDNSPALSPKYYMSIPDLKTGKYKFLAWANLDGMYSISSDKLIPGQTTLNELEVYLNNIKNSSVKERLTPLFFATHTNNEEFLVSKQMDREDFHLTLIDDIYKINVTVSGIDAKSLEKKFILDINDNNGRYKLTNAFASEDKFDYLTDCAVNDKMLSASLSVLRLADYRKNPVIRITMPENNNTAIVEDNLIEIILATLHENVDFNRKHVFNIHYDIDLTAPLNYQITIDGWTVIKNGGGDLGGLGYN
jgi:hypothetical protein